MSVTKNLPISPTFDVTKKSIVSGIKRTDAVIVPEIDMKLYPTKVWNPDARLQISTEQWLKKFGLRACNLDSSTLYPKLGFARLEGFNDVLKKPIHSKYGDKLFPQHFREDGLTFNVVAKKERLLQVQQELENAIQLYQQRLEWLSSESRRLFGVIEEHCVTIIIDVKTKSKRDFDQFICAVERLINEQIRYIAKFNLIRVQEVKCQLSPNLLPVNKENLANSIDFLWLIDRTSATNSANLVEAMIRASNNNENEAIYLITEDLSSDGSREVLREKVKQLRVPLNIISYNCKNDEFISYLQCLVAMTGGRFHSYVFNLEIDSYESSPLDLENPKASLLHKKKVYGGSVGGIGSRNDCVAVFSEIEEAKTIINQIKSLICQIPEKKGLYDDHYHHKHPLRVWNHSYGQKEWESCCGVKESHLCRYCVDNETQQNDKTTHVPKEEYMSSQEWLIKYGLKARKLDFYDVLGGVCFRHCDGVVDVMEPPTPDKLDLMEQQNATIHQKLVNAKYCDKFAHVKWKDGSLVHVQMSSDVHRLYSERMKLCLLAITRRIEWLRQGSRELFGTIMEDQVYILIDISASMEPHISFVKDKLYTLIQEQLRHKSKLNFVAFNTKALPWRDRLVDVTETNLRSAWQWLDGLTCQGSTNTLAALQFAIKDRNCQGIYLLTDGRPDQPTKTVLSQIRLQYRLPIHTISFNCADLEANTFLCELARETGGRFHYFNEISGGADCTNDSGLEAWESEDIQLLKAEYRLGFESLEKVTKLRDECHKLAWKTEIIKKKEQKSSRKTMAPGCNQNPYFSQSSPTQLPCEKREIKFPRPIKARNTYKKEQNKEIDPNAYQSFLESLTSRNENEQEWVVDETQEIIDRQTERYKKILEDEYKKAMAKKASKQKPGKPKCKELTLKQWLHIYGLVPQHMTILDALAPTIVKVRPKYVPIIDRHVMSKVFEEILPVSHVVTEGSPKSGYKPVIRLVNPLAVDLKGYQEKLQNLLKKYQKKLRQLIKIHLGDKVLEEFDDMLVKYPLGNDDVKRWLLKTFKEANWPVCEDDLEMFLKEIYIGQKYYIQSGDLLRTRKSSKMARNAPELEDQEKADMQYTNDPFSTILLAAMKGAHVLAPGPNDGYFYDAQIINWPNCDDVDVQFNMFSGVTNVPVADCIILPEKNPQLTAGMTALIKVFNIDNDRTFYLPGIVVSSHSGTRVEKYLVTLFNGLESNVRSDEIVPISRERYDKILQNIEAKMGNDPYATSLSTSIVSFSNSRNKNLSTAADVTNMKTLSKFSTPQKIYNDIEKSNKTKSGGKKLLRADPNSLSSNDKSAFKSKGKHSKESKPKLAKYSNLSCAQVDVEDQFAVNYIAGKQQIPQNQPQIIEYPNHPVISINDLVLNENILISQTSSTRNKSKNLSKSETISSKVYSNSTSFSKEIQQSKPDKIGFINENIIADFENNTLSIDDYNKELENNLITVNPSLEKTIEENILNNAINTIGLSIPTENYKLKKNITPEIITFKGETFPSVDLKPRLKTNPLSTGKDTTPILVAEQFPYPYSEFTHEIPGMESNFPKRNIEDLHSNIVDTTNKMKYSPVSSKPKVNNEETIPVNKFYDKIKLNSVDSLSKDSKFDSKKDKLSIDKIITRGVPVILENNEIEQPLKEMKKSSVLSLEITKEPDLKIDSKLPSKVSIETKSSQESKRITKPNPVDKSKSPVTDKSNTSQLKTTDKTIPTNKMINKELNDYSKSLINKQIKTISKSVSKTEVDNQLNDKAKKETDQIPQKISTDYKEIKKKDSEKIEKLDSFGYSPKEINSKSNRKSLQKEEMKLKEKSSRDFVKKISSQKSNSISDENNFIKESNIDIEINKKLSVDINLDDKDEQSKLKTKTKRHKSKKKISTKENDNEDIPQKESIFSSWTRKLDNALDKQKKQSKENKGISSKQNEVENEIDHKQITTEIGPKFVIENYDLPENEKTSQTPMKKHHGKRKHKTKEEKSFCKEICLKDDVTIRPDSTIPYPADVAVIENEQFGVYNIILTPTTSIILPQTHADCKSFEIANVSMTVREIPGVLMPVTNKHIKSLPAITEISKTYSYSSDELCQQCKLPKVPFGPDNSYKPRRTKSS